MLLDHKYLMAGLAILILGMAGQVHAEDAREPLRIGVMALAPYGYKDSGDDVYGNFLELSEAILEEGKFEGYAEVVPVHRVIEMGRTECAITANVESMASKYTQVADMGLEFEFGVLPMRTISLETYDDLKGVSLAVPVGGSMGQPFDSDKSLNKVEVQDYSAAMRMLELGRVDAAVGVINSLRFSAFIWGIDPEKFGKPLVFEKRKIVFFCHPQSKTKAYWPEIKAAIERLNAKGITKDIMEKY